MSFETLKGNRVFTRTESLGDLWKKAAKLLLVLASKNFFDLHMNKANLCCYSFENTQNYRLRTKFSVAFDRGSDICSFSRTQ